MTQWESKQQQLSSDDKKELANARNRLIELDSLIQGLYENQIKGIMPERQIQRLMTQYDNEQISLEKRIAELEEGINNETPKKPDPNRFISLIKKYKDITEINDTMLYELIDKIIVHAPVGGRTRYRYQQIDVCFNFIGNYLPPMPVITEEERRAKIDEYYAEKARAKGRKQCARKKISLEELKIKAETDPEAAKQLEAYYERKRELGRQARARMKARKEADPEYQAQQEAKRIERNKKNMERYYKKCIPIAELEKLAKTDPKMAEILTQRRAKQAEKNRENVRRRQERMEKDPEYAALVKARQAESERKHNEKRNAKMAALRKHAETDPEAAAELQKLAEYHRAENGIRNVMELDGFSGFVFCNRFGNFHNQASINREIKRIVNDYNAREEVNARRDGRKPIIVPGFSCHIARHTFCTRLCENETNIKVIQTIMGHNDIQTTMDIYAEVSEKKQQEVFRKLNTSNIV